MPDHFYDLKIWQEAHNLFLDIYRVTVDYPPEEKYCLVKDTRRSANSVCANIAEAHGRYFYADKIRVLYIARGEVEETQSHLINGKSLGYLSEEKFKKLNDRYENLNSSINQYINSLRSKIDH